VAELAEAGEERFVIGGAGAAIPTVVVEGGDVEGCRHWSA